MHALKQIGMNDVEEDKLIESFKNESKETETSLLGDSVESSRQDFSDKPKD